MKDKGRCRSSNQRRADNFRFQGPVSMAKYEFLQLVGDFRPVRIADSYQRGPTFEVYDRAIADFNKAIGLDRKSALAFRNRGDAFANKDDYDRAIADYNEAVRLDAKNALAFRSHSRAVADFNQAIRLDPKNALAFCNRGKTKRTIKDNSADADIAKSRELGEACE
jgi:tetratricopeptide (TPR) repeat protein